MRWRAALFPAALTVILCAVLTVTFIIGNKAKSTPEGGVLEVHFADVGQGDGIVIRTEESVILIDAGPFSDSSKLLSYLRRIGVEAVDLLIVTHPHTDHTGGAVRIMNGIEVESILLPKCTASESGYLRTVDCAEENGVNILQFDINEKYSFGELLLTPLAPIGDFYSDYNNFSTVMRLDFLGISFLLTGDAEIISEREMLSAGYGELLDCDVIKVGHHGSDTSSSEEFLSAVTPEYAVISCGRGNEFGHPVEDIVARLSSFCGADKIYRTDRHGSTVFIYDGESLNISTER